MDINNSRTDRDQDDSFNAIPKFQVSKMTIGQSVTGRIIEGAITRNSLWWPTHAVDPTTNETKATWRSASVDRNVTTPLDKVAQADKAIKQKLLEAAGQDKDDARSIFERTRKYMYAWIRRSKDGPVIELLEAPWSVVVGIRLLKTTVDPNNPDNLMYGLPYMYDILISVQENPKTHRRSYSVQYYKSILNVQGQIPTRFMDEKKFPFPDKGQFFSPEDLAIISEATWELDQVDPPVDVATVIERLQKFPVDLSRRQKNDANHFLLFNSQVELKNMMAVMENNGVDYRISDNTGFAQLPPGSSSIPIVQTMGQIENKPIPVQSEVVPEQTVTQAQIPLTNAVQIPEQPIQQTQTQPVAQVPSQPAVKIPGNPVQTQSQPVTQIPAQPVIQAQSQPVLPGVQIPGQPVAEVSPVYTNPGAPSPSPANNAIPNPNANVVPERPVPGGEPGAEFEEALW